MKKILLIDFENIQNINLDIIEKLDYQVYIFTGELQNKVPFELVKSAQKLGDKLEWIKIDGNGVNALDFHIAFFLGCQTEKNRDYEYIILSKDKGFDPLVRFITRQNVKCRRINSIIEIAPSEKKVDHKDEFKKVLDNLKKIARSKLPRKRNTLIQHVKTLFGKNINDEACNEIVDQLFIEEQVSEENGKLKYDF